MTALPGTSTGQAKQKAYRRIASAMEVFIRLEGYAVGTRLPGLEELAHSFGASRLLMREVLIALEAQNLVTMVRGVGTLVGPAFRDNDKDVEAALISTLEARRLVEGEIAAAAAAQRTPQAIHEFDLFGNALEKSPDHLLPEAFCELHVGIAKVVGNTPLENCVRYLWKPPRSDTCLLNQVITTCRSDWTTAHRRIIASIAQGDAESARREMNDFGDIALVGLFNQLERTAVSQVAKRLAGYRDRFRSTAFL